MFFRETSRSRRDVARYIAARARVSPVAPDASHTAATQRCWYLDCDERWRMRPRTQRHLVIVAATALIGLLTAVLHTGSVQAQAGQARDATPVFRGAVDLVSLNVTLTDQHDQLLSGMTASDFAVFEDGVLQDLSFFSSSRLPMDVAILLDTSSSMGPILTVAQDAAIGFVQTAQSADRVSVTEFNDRANIVHSLGSDVAGAADAIRSTSPRGSTALYNGLYMAMTEMIRSRRGSQEIRKQAVVVLSDGQDTSSLVQFDDVMALAHESGIVLYTILLLSPLDARLASDLKSSRFSQALFVMRSFAEATGGQTFLTSNARDLRGIYNRIANELALQYTLGYISKNAQRDGRFRRIVVRVVDHPGVRTRTRTGYQAPRSAASARPSR
jgi:Ca-activated chloride channel family protein